MKPLKILFLSHKFYPDIGGIEVNSEILANGFYKLGTEIKIVTWTEEKGGKLFPFEVVRCPNICRLLEVHRWADVVFENNPCLRLSWPSYFHRKPFLVALNTWINRTDGRIAWQDRLKEYWLSRASVVIAVSEAVRKRAWKNAIVIGNPYRQELFRQLPHITKCYDFVFLGRLVSDKGAELAVQAIHKLNTLDKCQMFSEDLLSLNIIGDGEEMDKLKLLVAELGLSKQVRFTGSLQGEDLVRCLNQHRYILVPSLWEEPFGNVALEGMACGCLPIVSDGGGLSDAVGKAGAVFRRGNLNALVECIRKIINNPSYENELRIASVEHLKAHYLEGVVYQYFKLVEEALK